MHCMCVAIYQTIELLGYYFSGQIKKIHDDIHKEFDQKDSMSVEEPWF